jgi:pyrroloquinoline quinone biosynthesis protein B
MKIRVLGSGAGGGFPQWNCNCDNCHRLRSGKLAGVARTQSSIAVSAGGSEWVLLNASPDIRAQLESFPSLQPARKRRDTAICAVLLVDAQIDHSTGLMTLRECDHPIPIYTTADVHGDLTGGYPLLTVLEHYCGVDWHEILLDASAFEIPGAEGLRFTAIPLVSEAPPYSPRRHAPGPGDNIGVRIEDVRSGGVLVYAPGLGTWDDALQAQMESASCVLVDGTVWTDDELSRAGVGSKLASEMGHLQQSGEFGLMERLEALRKPRKILIHINNTNPLLDEDSVEHKTMLQAGIELAYDGMDIEL